MEKKFLEIEICKIVCNPYQPRKQFSREELEELAQSIQSVGLIHPPIVVRLEGEEEKYELVSGERRVKAAELAGLKTLPVLLSNQDRTYSAAASLIENIQRVDLNPMEIARALKRLIIEFNYPQEELADRVGKKRSTVANYLRLLSLPGEIQNSVAAGGISMGHAKVILSLEGSEQQLALYQQIVAQDLSVREAEEAAVPLERTSYKRFPRVSTKDCFLEDLQTKIQHRFGTKVAISSTGKKGKISIDYYSLEDLERILDLLGVGN